MSVEVCEVSRKEVERWFNRKTVVRLNRVNATSDYILVSLTVAFDADFRNYWHPMSDKSNWQIIAHRQFNDLESAKDWCETHHLVSEHLVTRDCQRNGYACGFAIWHLVDDDDAAEVEALPDLLEVSKTLATVRYVGADVVRANFKSASRVMFELGLDVPVSSHLRSSYIKRISEVLDYLNLYYGISAMCSDFGWDESDCYSCVILLEYDGPCSAGWWYEHLMGLRSLQCLDWVFYRVRYVTDYLHFVMRRYNHLPEVMTGALDSDHMRRLASLVYADYYAPTSI